MITVDYTDCIYVWILLITAGVSSHSIASVGSETSSDYAVPPDEVSIQTDSSDNSEPEQKLLKYTTETFKKVTEVMNFLGTSGGGGQKYLSLYK